MCFSADNEGRTSLAGRAGKSTFPISARKLLQKLRRPVDRAAWSNPLGAMITLTPRAAERVRAMHAELNVPGRELRVFVESGGCSGFQYGMTFDEPKSDDQRLESEGVALLVDPSSLAYLEGCAIDFDDGLHGKGFEIRNPNATNTCGCGKSFS